MAIAGISILLESDEFDASAMQVFSVSGREAIGRLFSFDIELVHPDTAGLDEAEIIGAAASLVFEHRAETLAELPVIYRIHGMIAEIEDMLDPQASHRTYRLRLVPRAHRLTLVEMQEVFLDQSIPDILETKLTRVGLVNEDVEFRLLAHYPAREFVVQYRETDWAFVSRLAEHLGISIFFEHQSGRDVIVFSDQNSRFRPVEGDEAVSFRPRGEASEIYRLTSVSRMIPRTYLAQDYNYRHPRMDITGEHRLEAGYAGGVVEYGPHHLTPEEGATLAQYRAEERQATRQVLSGESAVSRFRAGATFDLEGHPRFESARLLLVEIEHHARQTVETHGGEDDAPTYRNVFRAIDVRVPYRPPRLTPKPRIAGVLSAQVEPLPDGELGDHARIDGAGRYTVRFFFDSSPLGARERSSLPVRMAQPHAGPNYGFHFPLKPGVEVLVAFTEGDPDRPFIIASVPNPITPSPVDRHNALFNKIETVSGVFLEIKDV